MELAVIITNNRWLYEQKKVQAEILHRNRKTKVFMQEMQTESKGQEKTL